MPLDACVSFSEAGHLLEFEEIQLGTLLTVTHRFSDEDVDAFVSLSGDNNPLHVHRQTARRAGFQDRTVHGFLLAALVSRISGTSFHNSVCAAISLDFVQPAFPGDRICLTAEVIQVQYTLRTISMKVKFTRGEDVIARGRLTTKFL
jgi:3-oxoacyl-[acyl-carrier protein] reductase